MIVKSIQISHELSFIYMVTAFCYDVWFYKRNCS